MSEFSSKAKRTALGLAAMLALLVVLDFLPRPWSAYSSSEAFFYFAIWPSLWGTFNIAVATFVGAYVAKVNFVGPAVIFVFIMALIVTLLAQTISVDVEAASYFEILARNVVNIAFALVGAVVGAVVGEWFSQRRRRPDSHAA